MCYGAIEIVVIVIMIIIIIIIIITSIMNDVSAYMSERNIINDSLYTHARTTQPIRYSMLAANICNV